MVDTSNIDWSDHKIAFACEGIEGKDVLDIGSAHHDPTTEAGPSCVHKAIRAKAGSVIGLDLDPEDVGYLQGKGSDMVVGNAHGFDLGRKFDVIFARLDGSDTLIGCGREFLQALCQFPWWSRAVMGHPRHT